MTSSSFPTFRTALVVAVLAFFSLGLQEASAADRLALRTNDAEGAPGGVVAVVIRTYASRPIGQGQICFRARRPPRRTAASTANATANATISPAAATDPGNPFVRLERAVVFSANGDARFTSSYVNGEAELSFNSPSGTINAADGPLAVLYFRLADWVSPGQEFEMSVELDESVIFEKSGQRVAIEPRPGRLRIRHPSDDFELEVETVAVVPGRVARLGIETERNLALSSGRIALRYDPRIAAAPPRIRRDRRYGFFNMTVDNSTPGLLVVDFVSPGATLNRVPGKIFDIRLPTLASVRPGTRVELTLDENLTYLVDIRGRMLPLEIEDGELVFRAPSP